MAIWTGAMKSLGRTLTVCIDNVSQTLCIEINSDILKLIRTPDKSLAVLSPGVNPDRYRYVVLVMETSRLQSYTHSGGSRGVLDITIQGAPVQAG